MLYKIYIRTKVCLIVFIITVIKKQIWITQIKIAEISAVT
jgi:hypothetical protein